ncbi:hypothetical protein Mtc_0726 [Methanocella conradii HZ254]|uniref:ABC-type transport system involved in multi-copper enzyme maturation, permease component n=1 Tax=Methanocella conradii (strain DSM 24694 / JCM 17849 / CGMCC 1.5162 / HZ254) TaxID=1041930 RepID=H8I8L4_METCZ|nr:ABC transporter permease subunit [Methanocella conradii]AFC99490.1 hypothetical protein Mtc_0726 [Methanocella conradii HZ254]
MRALIIAENEFLRLLRHPVIIIFVIVLCAMSVINAAGQSVHGPVTVSVGNPYVFMDGIGQIYYFTTLVFWSLALCLGVVSVSIDRSNGVLRLLLTKPLYRRDVIAGKFFGASAVLLALIMFHLFLASLLLTIAFRGPENFDIVLKVVSIGVVLFISCTFTLGIAMVLGTVLKDALSASIACISYFFLGLYVEMPVSTEWLRIVLSQSSLVNYWIFDNEVNIFLNNPPSIFSVWLGVAMPYIIFLALEALAVFLAACLLFNREEA